MPPPAPASSSPPTADRRDLPRPGRLGAVPPDLATGHRPAHWPAFFVARELETTIAKLRANLNTPPMALRADEDQALRVIGDGPGPRVNGPAAEVLGWLTGRTDGHTLTPKPRTDGRLAAAIRSLRTARGHVSA
ncbi:hypothetical protein [Streptomyces sp. NPDC003006]